LIAPEAWIIAAAIASSALVYFPFRSNPRTLYRYWDGPSYLTIARDGYHSAPDNPLASDPSKPPFYLAHLPGYPALVRLLSFIGYERALLAASVVSAALAAIIFFRLARDVWKLDSPLFLSLVFLFATPRWLLYRSVSASEPLFLALVLIAIFAFERERFLFASLAGALAALTRPVGVLIYPAFALVLFLRGRRREQLFLLAIPAALAGYLFFCQQVFGTASAMEPNLEHFSSLVPFHVLGWFLQQGRLIPQAEFYILMALVYAVGILRLGAFPVPQAYAAFQFALVLIVGSEDWSRFLLPIMPFAIVLGFREILDTRVFRCILPGLVVLETYYAWNVIPRNLCPPDVYGKILAYLRLTP
jgi:hypothetical protein